MKYKQEFLNCFETEDTIRKLKAIIEFVEDKEKKYNKEINDFTREELKGIFEDIKDYYVTLHDIRTNKEDIYYYINYYLEVVKELEKEKGVVE